MNIGSRDDLKTEEFLYMEWLRPEVIVWHTVAADLIGSALRTMENTMEVACGNGFFTFMCLDGVFKPTFDHYYSVNVTDYRNNEDLYDSEAIENIADFIQRPASTNLVRVVDHKQSLLDQVAQLDFSNEQICQDANTELSLSGVQSIYCNSIYWFNEPLRILEDWAARLPSKAKLALVFPNERFYKYCRSYNRESPMWSMLNRGRADTLMWSASLSEFEKATKNMGLDITEHTSYLSKLTLQIDDIGLRPISPHTIKMANLLSAEQRFEVKEEWIETFRVVIKELLEHELHHGPTEGGFEFVVLEKA